MVVVSLEPRFRFMDRSGMATGTRAVAETIWRNRLPGRNPARLVRDLYRAENKGKAGPSGSQDMIGLLYPGISRLDYDFAREGGVFPSHIESTNNPLVVRWLENVLHVLPIAPRPAGYNPLGRKQLESQWIAKLGETGKACFKSILHRDADGLGASFNECMECWERLLPNTVSHPALTLDLKQLLRAYQSEYLGAMYSGCGGGYLFVVSREPVPGAFKINVRTAVSRSRAAD
jgi:hypothetical protein